jgi:hypothetical protein
MRREPMFVRFANKLVGTDGVVKSFIDASEHRKSIKIAEDSLENLPDLSVFRKDFGNALEDLIDNGINRQLITYLDCYMKPSLSEVLEGDGRNMTAENRWVLIKSKEAPWIEALVCYNLTLYIKAFGHKELKRCTVCGKFFTNKGKYAKYCSEGCKNRK